VRHLQRRHQPRRHPATVAVVVQDHALVVEVEPQAQWIVLDVQFRR
jgi:hypothetical protein